MAGFKQQIIEEGAGDGKLYEGDVFVDNVRYKYWVTQLPIDSTFNIGTQREKRPRKLFGVFFLKHSWEYLFGQTCRLVISGTKKLRIVVTLEGPLGRWHFFKRAAG